LNIEGMDFLKLFNPLTPGRFWFKNIVVSLLGVRV